MLTSHQVEAGQRQCRKLLVCLAAYEMHCGASRSCTVLSGGKPLYLKAKTFQCASIHMHISMPCLSKGLSFEIQKDKHIFEMDR